MKRSVDETGALLERVKELHCLYEISRLFSQGSLRLDGLLREIADIIPKAWRFPERTCARIVHAGREHRSGNYAPAKAVLRERIDARGAEGGFVEVSCLEGPADPHGPVFLQEEKKLLKAIAGLLKSIIEKKEAEISLRRTTEELRRQTVELEHKNVALREIVSQIGLEKKTLQEQMKLTVELTVLPLLQKLHSAELAPELRRSYLKVIEQNLEDAASPFARRIIEDRVRLSPRELEVCNLIKNGLGNKEIAGQLGISVLTVERHRHNVRRKLRIDNERVNLATYLRSL